jgi:hypothetical protein
MDGVVDFVKVDVDRELDVAAAYSISSIPAFVRFEIGRPSPLGRRPPGAPWPASSDSRDPPSTIHRGRALGIFARRRAT